MTRESDEVTLIRGTAQAFAERHRPELGDRQDDAKAPLPVNVLAEMANMGWLDALGEDQGAEAVTVLSTLVFELGRVSPPLGARLLCHHFAREWVEAARGVDTELPHAAASWLSLAAFEPRPTAHEALATMVVGLAESHALLNDDQSTGTRRLLMIPRSVLGNASVVPTLGLHGLSVVDVRLSATATAAAHVICEGPAVPRSRATAWRRILPAYVSLCRAVVATSLHNALEHAAARRQGGARLSDLPEVQFMLDTMRSDLALVTLVEQSGLAGNDNTVLLARVRHALLAATDTGIQVLGGAGYVVGTGQERLWRDARQLATLLVPSWVEAGSVE